jgi:hypothetical protein
MLTITCDLCQKDMTREPQAERTPIKEMRMPYQHRGKELVFIKMTSLQGIDGNVNDACQSCLDELTTILGKL